MKYQPPTIIEAIEFLDKHESELEEMLDFQHRFGGESTIHLDRSKWSHDTRTMLLYHDLVLYRMKKQAGMLDGEDHMG